MGNRTLAGLAVVLAGVNGLSPLFTSNQNTYLLHAMAQAGYGRVESGWMAQTADLTPVFTALAVWGYDLMGSWFFYVASLAAATIFFASLLVIARHYLAGRELLLVTVILAIFASPAIDQFAPTRIALEGLAYQSVQGTYAQPNNAGVLIVLALAIYVVRPEATKLVAIVAGCAALLHPTYILPGGLVILGAATVEYLKGNSRRHTVLPVLLYGVVTAPMALYVLRYIPASDTAVRILVHSRVPHHALPEVWFGLDDAAAITLVVGAVWLYRSEDIGRVLGVTGVLGLVVSLTAAILGSDRLLLIYPWRVSTILVPVSTALLLAWGAHRIARPLPDRVWRLLPIATACGLACLVAASALLVLRDFRAPDTFRSVPKGTYLIPPELEQFRLESGQPILVDANNPPFRGDEVVEWWRRLNAARGFYATMRCDELSGITGRWPVITHVAIPASKPMTCAGERMGAAGSYAIYRLDSREGS